MESQTRLERLTSNSFSAEDMTEEDKKGEVGEEKVQASSTPQV